MSDVTEIEVTGLCSSESWQSRNQYSRMEILQVNSTMAELSSTLIASETRNKESENYQQPEKYLIYSNAEIANDSSDDGNLSKIDTNFQKFENKHSLMLGFNVHTIENHYVNNDSHFQDQMEQVFKEAETLVEPIVKTAEKQCTKNTYLQESNRQDDNKTLLQNSSVHPILQTDKSFNTSSFPISTMKESKSHNPTSLKTSTTKNIQSPNPSSLRIPTTEEIQSHAQIIQSRHILAADAPMLTYILVKIPASESKTDKYLSILDSMKRIEKWFAKLDELNQYNTSRFQALIEKMVEFKRIESLVQEKQFMLTIGKDLSLLDLQSNLETSTYTSLCSHCEHILRLLKFYGRYLNSAYERHSKLRIRYLDCSLQVAMYPIEDKLFENRKQTMNIINQSSKLMNKMSLKLDETDNYTENLSFQCISVVNNFLSDCEVTFSP